MFAFQYPTSKKFGGFEKQFSAKISWVALSGNAKNLQKNLQI